jgi:hypothetical protein
MGKIIRIGVQLRPWLTTTGHAVQTTPLTTSFQVTPCDWPLTFFVFFFCAVTQICVFVTT